MELKPGFKQTEAGVIPEDWETKRLGELFDFTNGRPHEAHLKECGRFSLITLDSIDINGSLKRTHKQTDAWDNSLRKSDLVAVLSDLAKGDLLGLCDLIPEDNLYVLNQRMGRLRARALVNSYFARLQINSRQSHFKARSQGSAQRHVYRRDFDTLSIPCPSVQEQSSIANALLDIDAMRISLEEIISKKRLIKQAFMQELLAGKRRLPGFDGEWEVKRLGDVISHCFSGATPRRNRPEFYKGNVRWITSGELNYNLITDTLEKITSEAVAETNLTIHPVGTFLMAITGLEAEGTRGACGITGAPSTTNQSCMAVFPKDSLAGEYLFHYYVYRGKSFALQYCQGTKQQSYTASFVKQLPIDLPPTIAEQIAIAEVLTEMDDELAGLEARVCKIRALKQGMMQKLLTGKIRLT
jgi:type I restriction enzyme S subunit